MRFLHPLSVMYLNKGESHAIQEVFDKYPESFMTCLFIFNTDTIMFKCSADRVLFAKVNISLMFAILLLPEFKTFANK